MKHLLCVLNSWSLLSGEAFEGYQSISNECPQIAWFKEIDQGMRNTQNHLNTSRISLQHKYVLPCQYIRDFADFILHGSRDPRFSKIK